jgi:protoheme IX farnesyltransferase
MVSMTGATREIAASEVPGAHPRARALDYLSLTRPKVLLLVLFTVPAALLVGHAVLPGPGVVLGVLAGTALVGGGCGALNAWWEREPDAKMQRTADRPLPAGRIPPGRALAFGIVISLAGLAALQVAGGTLATGLGAASLVHYLVVYTIWLKPRTPQAVVIGGLSGAAAPLIADAAVDGVIGPWGLVLFAIIFVWQPPHFWAIALYRREDYEAAGFPMLPSVIGETATRRRMLVWALALIPVALLPWWSGVCGPAYGSVALLGGVAFAADIVRSQHRATPEADRSVFRTSIIYLSALFAVMLGEALLR